jgi:hypothetical protein
MNENVSQRHSEGAHSLKGNAGIGLLEGQSEVDGDRHRCTYGLDKYFLLVEVKEERVHTLEIGHFGLLPCDENLIRSKSWVKGWGLMDLDL